MPGDARLNGNYLFRFGYGLSLPFVPEKFLLYSLGLGFGSTAGHNTGSGRLLSDLLDLKDIMLHQKLQHNMISRAPESSGDVSMVLTSM